MKHSRKNPALSLGEPDGLTPDPEAADAAARLAAAVARDLISIRSLPEMEERVLELIRDAAGGGWVALYRPTEPGYTRARVGGIDESELAETIDAAVVAKLLDGAGTMGPISDGDLGQQLPGVAAFARLQGEFELQPALLLLGACIRDGEPAPHFDDLQAVTEVCAIALRNAELVYRLQSEVFIDFVTHCYNRRAFEEHLTVELVRARRYERPLCLLLMDLDDFKQVNDGLGHPVGDYVLQRVGETLRATFRTTDRVCRYGGDEFAVIFPETPKDDVLRLAERLRRQIGKLFPDSVIPTPISASIGVAAYPADANRADELVKAADKALYRAKDGGRNQVAPA